MWLETAGTAVGIEQEGVPTTAKGDMVRTSCRGWSHQHGPTKAGSTRRPFISRKSNNESLQSINDKHECRWGRSHLN